MNKRILLIGGSGYLGRHLYKNLVGQGADVIISGLENFDRSNYYQIDLDKPETFCSIRNEQFDVILILASRLQSLGTCQLDHPDLETNVFGLSRFLEYVKKNGNTNKLIYISSMTVYSPENDSPVDESAKLAPLSTYGLSKKLAEHVMDFYCRNEDAKGVIMRFPGIYGGDRQSGFIYNTIQKVSSGQTVTLNTKGLGYWETIHISDLVDMISDFLIRYEWQETINTFNFSYGEETDFYDTAYMIAERMNRKNLIEIEEDRGYVKLYISNAKVSQYAKPSMNYSARLKEYIDSIK